MQLHAQLIAPNGQLILILKQDRFTVAKWPTIDHDRVGVADVAQRVHARGATHLGLQARDITRRIGQRHRVAVRAANRSAALVELGDD